MKISKYFMVAAASIMMFGCAKNDNNGLDNSEPVAFSVKIVKPEALTKAPGNFTEADGEGNILVCKNVTITLKNADGGVIATASDLVLDDLSDDTYTFWNVQKPTSVEVSINGGVESYENLDAVDGEPASMPAFGKTTSITYEGLKAYDETLAGNDAGEAGMSYSNYVATVNVRIPVARLEMGGIQHVVGEGGSLFDNLTFLSVEVRNAGASGEYSEANSVFEAGESETLLDDEVNADFLADGAVFPATGCYVYNFFVSADKQPEVAFNFSTLNGKETVKLYAVVDHFVGTDSQPITAFEAGKIYQIKTIAIEDSDLSTDPSGEDAISVTVTVVVHDWKIVPLNGVEFK